MLNKWLFILVVLGLGRESVSFLNAVPAGKLPSSRYGTSAAFDGKDSIFIFCGMYLDWGDPREMFDQILRYNITSEAIVEVGAFPIPIAFQSAVIDTNGDVFVLGGAWEEVDYQSTIWKFNVQDINPVKVGNLPDRYGYSTSAYDGEDSIFTFGGFGGGANWFSRKHVVEFRINSSKAQVVGELPEVTNGASSAIVGDAAYIFGGDLEYGTFSDKIFKYNISTHESELLTTRLPVPIIYSTAVKVRNNLIAVVGGGLEDSDNNFFMLLFDPVTEEIQNIYVSNLLIGYHHASSVFVEATNRIYLFGGGSWSGSPLDDIYYIELL